MRHRRRNKMFLRVVLLIALLVSFSVGYAYLNKTLSIEGTTTVAKTTWNVRFSNIQVIENNAIVESAPTLADNATKVNFTINLDKPGDSYAFTVDVVNSGTLDAKLGSISISGLSGKSYLDYSITYIDGVALQTGDELKAGHRERIKVIIRFKRDITANDLESDLTVLNLVVSATYAQADGTETPVNHQAICRKATTLHQTTCQYESENGCTRAETGYSTNDTITYGHTDSEKLVDGQLTSGVSQGYALTCDVNGDTIFDEINERFYYVSDYYDTINNSWNNNYAVLIFWNNVKNGEIDSTAPIHYNVRSSTWTGPALAISYLPTPSQWSNVSLLYNKRNILFNDGNIAVSNFDYSGYVARLLNRKELVTACGSGTTNMGYLKNCTFAVENSYFESGEIGSAYYIENRYSSSESYNYVYFISGKSLRLYPSNDFSFGPYAVRPVIEVPKANISLE